MLSLPGILNVRDCHIIWLILSFSSLQFHNLGDGVVDIDILFLTEW